MTTAEDTPNCEGESSSSVEEEVPKKKKRKRCAIINSVNM